MQTERGETLVHDRVVVAAVEVQRVEVGEQPGGGDGLHRRHEHAHVVSVGAVDHPADRHTMASDATVHFQPDFARPRLAALLMLGALTGMRRGELCALRWSDIDLERGELEVSRSVIVVPGGLAEKTTKTGRSRPVALDEVGVALLVQYRARADDWASDAEAVLAEDAFVFSLVDCPTPFRPDNGASFFIRIRDGLGFTGVRLHGLRHFTATQLIGAGVDVRTVAGRLGHSDPSLTLRVTAM